MPKTTLKMSQGHSGTLSIEYLTTYNYSMHINHSDTLIKCEIHNESDSTWTDVRIDISGAMLRQCHHVISAVPAHTTVDITKSVKIDIDPSLLLQLSEGTETEIGIKVTIADTQVIDDHLPLKLMAYDQWVGIDIRPELLASFVTPNHPILSRVSVEASRFMEKLTGRADLDEYQSQDVNRARAQVAAIYEALRSEGIVYASIPPSYEHTGQRIRTVDKVLDEKLGTCIDLSLLFASCLESIGINPLLILTKEHCMVGAWTVKDSYTRAVGDDVDFLLKSGADGIAEIVVLESTALTSSSDVTFDQAVEMAWRTLRKADDFLLFVDVYRSRVAGIRPLPLRVKDQDQWVIENDGVEHSHATEQVKDYSRYDLGQYDQGEQRLTKFMLWERKLLDFSLRNNLLNMRRGKKVIPLVSYSLDRIENMLQGGTTFQIKQWPRQEPPKIDINGMYESADYPDLQKYVTDGLEHNTLYSFQDEALLKESVKYVYRAARTSLEENGASNLYMVIGALRWYETERSQQARYAPLLLVPIDIVRKSGGLGYALRSRDEDTLLNVTLAQLLQQQYDINLTALDDLPKDESGVDVRKVLAVIRDKVRDRKGWNVLDETLIGLFSFNKFVMWRDIHTNSGTLQSHEIISSLVDGKLNISDLDEDIDVKRADRDTPADQVLTPIDIDSSQLEAVIAANSGKSFILHGPPGTGKSQTITNIIANALYHGKRVLFVAEKMAALSVVQSRLEKIGLAPFCLELHSNKVTKRHFLGQMETALNISRRQSPDDYKKVAEDLYRLRCQLIDTIDTLHQKGSNGLSLYDCIIQYLSSPGEALNIEIEHFDTLDQYSIEKICEEVEALDAVLKICGTPTESPLRDLNIKVGTIEGEKALAGSLESLTQDIGKWKSLRDDFAERFGIEIPDSLAGIDWTTKFLRQTLSMPLSDGMIISLCTDNRRITRIKEALKAGRKAMEMSESLAKEYTRSILRLESQDLAQKWQQARSKWFIPRYFACKSLLQMMGIYKVKFSESDMITVIDSLRQIEEYRIAYEKRSSEILRVFGEEELDVQDYPVIQETLESLPYIHDLMAQWAKLQHTQPQQAIDTIKDAYTCSVRSDSARWEEAIDLGNRVLSAITRFESVASTGFSDDSFCADLSEKMQRWQGGLPLYNDWYIWCRDRSKLLEQHLGCVIQYISADVPHTATEAAMALKKGIYSAMARNIVDSNEELRSFRGLMMEEKVKRYRQLTARLQNLSIQELYCRLCEKVPSQVMEAHENSELGILKRNIKNGGRGSSIRKIIDNIPTLLPKLAPCMLMSPLSVAQYLDLANEKFDIVIFDEASQMPTSEAVGAIARGKSLIVVGDPKQMPPSSFFVTSAVGEDEAEIDDMDSILDDCISVSVPSKHLTWHYRSSHESLISFSNSQYYEGKLLTFPSTDDQVSKVTLRRIEGVYDKGKTRSNKYEARAIVDEVISRLGDQTHADESIGIVSFSKVQQDLIEDMLTDELSKHPALEEKAFGSEEPIFVKNLENVQGDERDVILFSVGYGPDANGKVSMNFGPLNNAGGERRLNVAVSRARHEMVVFSTLRSEQIDLRRSNAAGVMGLKKFLEYAESGTNAVYAEDLNLQSDTVITTQIADALREHGYDTHLSLGRSKFKIDVAVASPAKPQAYLMGILIDGTSYHNVKTMRDKEVVQPAVLQRLGWHVMRVRTLDWYQRRDEVIASILQNLDSVKSGLSDNAPEVPEEVTAEANITPVDTPDITATAPSAKYQQAEIMPHCEAGNIEMLVERKREAISDIKKIVKAEQPITATLVSKRMIKAWGISRVTAKVQGVIDSMLADSGLYSEANGNNGLTYYCTKDDAECFDKFRTDSDREISDIPYVETSIAMRYAIDQQVAIDRDGLKLLTLRLMGFSRNGTNIDNHLEYVLSSLIVDGYVKVDGNKVCKIDR